MVDNPISVEFSRAEGTRSVLSWLCYTSTSDDKLFLPSLIVLSRLTLCVSVTICTSESYRRTSSGLLARNEIIIRHCQVVVH